MALTVQSSTAGELQINAFLAPNVEGGVIVAATLPAGVTIVTPSNGQLIVIGAPVVAHLSGGVIVVGLP